MITNVSYPDISRKKIRDFTIPSIGLGTHKLTGKVCQDAVIKALLHGYRHIDTAQAYDNEADIGQAIVDMGIPRKKIFITDKIWFDRLKHKNLVNSFHQSLEKLQTNYVDLLLIHWPPMEDLELITEALKTMDGLQRKGYIRKIGVSNFTPKLMMQALTDDEIIANQIEYHPFLSQSDLIELAVIYNYFVIAYAPLAQGKVMQNNLLMHMGKKYDKTPAQISLRWLIQQYNVVAIPRSSKIDHIKSNIEIFDFELTESEMNDISKLSTGKRLIDPDFAPEWNEAYTINK
jgi:2,5-diketo-D-gluconate reductase B